MPRVSGGGMRLTIASSTSAQPTPVFAETRRGSSIGIARISSTSRLTSFTSAPGKSTLLRTGTISSFASCAKYVLATVCASTPCAASTTRIAPSHAPIERETSYAKSTCPGVSRRLKRYVLPSLASYCIVTGCDLIVMPRSRSRSIASSVCSLSSRALTACVSSRMRSESVVLPWSTCAMIQKLRMFSSFTFTWLP